MVADYTTFSPLSRTWVFQAEKELTDEEIAQGKKLIQEFIENWTSHRVDLPANGDILFRRFLVFVADDQRVAVGGCSQDSLMRFIHMLGTEWNNPLLERTQVAYRQTPDSPVEILPLDQLKDAYQKGVIQDTTLVYDNLVNTLEKFETSWLKPLKESWHKRFV